MYMKNAARLLFALLFTLSTLSFAQTGKEIIDKNIELSGGLTQWKLLNSVILSGRVTLGIKDEYPIRIYQQRPNLTKTVITIGKKETAIEGYDGENGYAMNYASNKLQKYPNYVPESFDNDFIEFEKKGFQAEYLGKEKVGDIETFKVELTKNVNKTYYYFDTKSYMLLKEETKNEVLLYSDYKKVAGLYFPFHIESQTPGSESDYLMLLNKIEVNREIPKETFKF